MQKYYRLYRELKARILSGAYNSGEKLPSKRVLADREGVSVITEVGGQAVLGRQT